MTIIPESIGMPRRKLSTSRWMAFIPAMALAAGVGCAPRASTGSGLAATRLRVTNEVVEADLAMIGIWRERLDVVRDRLDTSSASAEEARNRRYALAKAGAWLSFARDEYATEPRSEVADAALEKGRTLVEALERDSLPPMTHAADSNVIAGTGVPHPELWRGAAALVADTNWGAVARDVAELEVALVRAGRVEAAVGAACRTELHLIHARRILARANMRLRELETPTLAAAVPESAATPARRPADRPVTVSVHFALDRAELSQASRDLLGEVVRVLVAHPDYGVVLEGHADPRGSAAYNVALSRRRVEAVRDYLAIQGVVVDRLEARARGTELRAATGASALDYALDRRVTLQFLAPDGTLLMEGKAPNDLQIETNRARNSRAPRPRKGSR